MVADDGQGLAQRLERLADGFAGDGMPLHDLPFFLREKFAFLQDRVRHHDFAQVVQHAAAAQRGDVVLIEPEVLAELGAHPGESLAMAFGVGIARLYAQGEDEEDRFHALQLVGEFLELEQRFDARKQLFRKDGLVEEVVGAGLDAAHAIFAVGEAGDYDDRNQPGRDITLESVADLIAAAPGHDDAGQSKEHAIVFGRALSVQLFIGPGETQGTPLAVRPLYVDARLKEFTTGDPHDVTDRTFVVRRVFRINDRLPDDPKAAPHWQWQRGGWLLVDRSTGHVGPMNLPEVDPY